MTGLSDKQLAALRKRLDKRELELSAELAAINSEAIDGPARVPQEEVSDLADLGEAATRETVRQAEKDRDALELRQIAAAKERMRQGRYGLCIDCGAPIPRARLEVQPASERCVPCQEAFER
ncbi:MAG: TraR/DksA family transcriptional regulator [Variovorax sp.]|nr:TraR/DksA family transcriptional regulator [Variovorax sp.]